jgi:hypothetical protein
MQYILLAVHGSERHSLVGLARRRGWYTSAAIEAPETGALEVCEQVRELCPPGLVDELAVNDVCLPGLGVLRLLEELGAVVSADALGKTLGRPRALVPIETVLRMRSHGASLRVIARATELGVSTIRRFLVAHAASSSPVVSRCR